jgi:hypothetical protein
MAKSARVQPRFEWTTTLHQLPKPADPLRVGQVHSARAEYLAVGELMDTRSGNSATSRLTDKVHSRQCS